MKVASSRCPTRTKVEFIFSEAVQLIVKLEVIGMWLQSRVPGVARIRTCKGRKRL